MFIQNRGRGCCAGTPVQRKADVVVLNSYDATRRGSLLFLRCILEDAFLLNVQYWKVFEVLRRFWKCKCMRIRFQQSREQSRSFSKPLAYWLDGFLQPWPWFLDISEESHFLYRCHSLLNVKHQSSDDRNECQDKRIEDSWNCDQNTIRHREVEGKMHCSPTHQLNQRADSLYRVSHSHPAHPGRYPASPLSPRQRPGSPPSGPLKLHHQLTRHSQNPEIRKQSLNFAE